MSQYNSHHVISPLRTVLGAFEALRETLKLLSEVTICVAWLVVPASLLAMLADFLFFDHVRGHCYFRACILAVFSSYKCIFSTSRHAVSLSSGLSSDDSSAGAFSCRHLMLLPPSYSGPVPSFIPFIMLTVICLVILFPVYYVSSVIGR